MFVQRLLRAGALLALASCLDPTQVTLLIHTTASCGPDGSPVLRETGILASDEAVPTGAPQGLQLGCKKPGSKDANVGTLVVYPRSGGGAANVLIVGSLDTQSVETCLSALGSGGDVSGCIFARRRLAFIEHTSLRLGVTLDPACAGTVCDANSTCSVGPNGPRCVSSTVECRGSDCDLPDAEGGGGAGGGGGGGGGAPVTRLVWLPKPSTQMNVRPSDVSDDGSVVVGRGLEPTGSVPVAWRNEQLFAGAAAGVEGGNGEIVRACGNGDRVVGFLGGGAPNGTMWQYVPGEGYRTQWVGVPGTQFFDCDATGTRQFGLASDVAATFANGVQMASLPSHRAKVCDRNCEIGVADAISASSKPALVSIDNVNLMITEQGDFNVIGGTCPAMDRQATLVACRIPSTQTVRVFDMMNATPIYDQQNDFSPSDLAVSPNMGTYLAVGSCNGGGQRACVLVDGAGPFEIQAGSPRSWPKTQQLDFEGRTPIALSAISADRKTVVGYATSPNGGIDPFVIYLE